METITGRYENLEGIEVILITGKIPDKAIFEFFCQQSPYTFSPREGKKPASVRIKVNSKEDCVKKVDEMNSKLGAYDCIIKYQE